MQQPKKQNKMKKLITIILLTTPIGIIHAQEVVSSTGESYSYDGYEVSWTLGELVIETVSNETNTLTQGFHQNNLNVTLIDELNLPGLEFKVYPNPADYIIYIQSKGRTDVKLQFVLFDVNGKKLLNKKFIENPTELNMAQYAAGNYFLSITTIDGEPVQKFKIVKR